MAIESTVAKIPRYRAANRVDLTGMKFGFLTARKLIGVNKERRAVWLCDCDCGETVYCSGRALTKGMNTSCGCKRTLENHHGWKGFGGISQTRWSGMLNDARKRSLPVEISIEDAWKLFQDQDGVCALSGIELSFGEYAKRSKKLTASLDRIDSTKGYIRGNIQWVHKRINMMKQAMSDGEFVEFCTKVAMYNHI
jgi:hypothetical protein